MSCISAGVAAAIGCACGIVGVICSALGTWFILERYHNRESSEPTYDTPPDAAPYPKQPNGNDPRPHFYPGEPSLGSCTSPTSLKNISTISNKSLDIPDERSNARNTAEIAATQLQNSIPDLRSQEDEDHYESYQDRPEASSTMDRTANTPASPLVVKKVVVPNLEVNVNDSSWQGSLYDGFEESRNTRIFTKPSVSKRRPVKPMVPAPPPPKPQPVMALSSDYETNQPETRDNAIDKVNHTSPELELAGDDAFQIDEMGDQDFPPPPPGIGDYGQWDQNTDTDDMAAYEQPEIASEVTYINIVAPKQAKPPIRSKPNFLASNDDHQFS